MTNPTNPQTLSPQPPRTPPAALLNVKNDNKAAVVTLDPAPVNALSLAVLKEVKATFDELAKNDEVRAVVLTGAGNHAFCAGADLKAFAGLDPQQAAEIVKTGHEAFNAVE